jgi:hypothetical protein
VHALHNLYRYTGDHDVVSRHLAVDDQVLRWFVHYQDENGLLRDVTGWVIIDWSNTYDTDTSCSLNGLWARGLREFAEMAEWLGDGGRAAWARTTWDRVARSFDRFWDDGRGAYVDHLVDGKPGRPMSQHASAAAICAGVVPADRYGRIVDVITDRARLVSRSWMLEALFVSQDWEPVMTAMMTGPPPPEWDAEHQIMAAQPFFRYVVHDAIARAGYADRLADLCRDWAKPLEEGATTWPETWIGGSHCHGWSSIPSHDLVVHVLGIQPAEPGFERVRVAPSLGDLEWARGAAPSPHGLVHVSVSPDEITVESPRPVEIDKGAGTETRPAGRHTLRRG